jgi:multidrug efflux pump
MKLVIDQDRARALGVTSQRIRQMLQTAMSGAPLDDFRDGEETVSIVAREPDASRSAAVGGQLGLYPDRFRRLRAALAGRQGRAGAGAGHRVAARPPADDQRAGDAARWRAVERRRHEDVPTCRPCATACRPATRSRSRAAPRMRRKARMSIAAKAPIMLAVIVVLLMMQLQHFGKAMLVLATGPLGIIGAAAALLISGAPFGFVAILGVIALLGIIMRNSIILVDQIDQDIKAGMDRSGGDHRGGRAAFPADHADGDDGGAGADPDLARRVLGAARLRDDGRHPGRHRADHPGAAGRLRPVLRPGAEDLRRMRWRTPCRALPAAARHWKARHRPGRWSRL